MKTAPAVIEKTWGEGFAARPAVASNDANMSAITEWLTENLKPFNSFNVVKAIDAINAEHPNRLAQVVTEADRARRTARVEAMLNPTAPVAPVAAAPALTEQEQLKSLQRALRSSDPQIVAVATAELKERADKEAKIDRFNRMYTKRGLANMGKLELDAVVRLYGAELVSNRLNS